MSDILEIVLENIPHQNVFRVLRLLLEQSGKILEVECSEKIKINIDNGVSKMDIENFMHLSEDACLFLKLDYIHLAKFKIPLVLIRLVKYGGLFDIDFNFEESDIANMGAAELMGSLHPSISELCEKNDVNNWFGGLEPAVDEETRYFTGKKLGPLKY